MPPRHPGKAWRRRGFAAGYDSAVHCGPAMVAGARLLWGYDASLAWAAINRLAEAGPGAAVLDMPSGGGIALRGLLPGQRARYVAADISPVMLARVRARSRQRSGVGLVRADVAALPFKSGVFDLCLSFNGLHCFPDPAAAIREYARILRPAGQLLGTAIITGTGRRPDVVTRVLRRVNAFGPPIHQTELATWLSATGFRDVRVDRSGAVAHFTARLGHDGVPVLPAMAPLMPW